MADTTLYFDHALLGDGWAAEVRLTIAGGRISADFGDDCGCREKIFYVDNWYKFTNLEGDRNFYYQQRYNYHAERDTLTVDMFGDQQPVKPSPSAST